MNELPNTALTNRTMPPGQVIPVLAYEDVEKAVEWLCRTFGFTERWRVGNHRAQLAFGNGAIALSAVQRSGAAPNDRHSMMIRVADVVLHYEHAKQCGARILQAPTNYPYGEKQYVAEDPEGHTWMFSQSIADLAPEDWGGTSGK